MNAAPPPDDGDAPAPAVPPAELLTFPTDFPIKIMGRRVDTFTDEIVAVLRRHAPDFDAATLEMRPSRQGTYLGLTATIRATSRAQLDALYRELSAHPLVKVVL
jgi:putative lipoic acid-binding regulatory protein